MGTDVVGVAVGVEVNESLVEVKNEMVGMSCDARRQEWIRRHL